MIVLHVNQVPFSVGGFPERQGDWSKPALARSTIEGMFESSLKSIQQILISEVSSTSKEGIEGALGDGTPLKGKKPGSSNRPTIPTSVVLEYSIVCCGPPPGGQWTKNYISTRSSRIIHSRLRGTTIQRRWYIMVCHSLNIWSSIGICFSFGPCFYNIIKSFYNILLWIINKWFPICSNIACLKVRYCWKFSSKNKWNCGDTRSVFGFITISTLPKCNGEWPRYIPSWARGSHLGGPAPPELCKRASKM